MYVENNFTRLNYDPCSYSEKLSRSTGPGVYMINTPGNDCRECSQDVPPDPYLRYQQFGAASCPPGSAIDVSSELNGLNYLNSGCMNEQYLPGKYKESVCQPKGKASAYACDLQKPTESTRLTNGPCTLRGTGINRWEWLCFDPQQNAIEPFEFLVNNRLVTKDNHIPCIEKPMDQTNILPSQKNNEISPEWKNCNTSNLAANLAMVYPYSSKSIFSCNDMNSR